MCLPSRAVASKYSVYDMENNNQSKLCSVFKYSPNGKGIMTPMKYILIIYSPNGNHMVLWKNAFGIDNRHGKKLKKMQQERYNVNQN